MLKFIPNTCPENLFQTHAQIYSKHMPRKFKKKTQIRNDAVFVCEDLEGALAGDDLSPEPMQYSLCLAHNESPYVVLFLLADPALAGDDLAPDLIDGFRNRNGIRGFDEGDLGVLLANPGEGSTRRRKRSTRVLGSYESRLADRESRA